MVVPLVFHTQHVEGMISHTIPQPWDNIHPPPPEDTHGVSKDYFLPGDFRGAPGPPFPVRSMYSPNSVFYLFLQRVDFFHHLHTMKEVRSLQG
jgi:hypothetical protein